MRGDKKERKGKYEGAREGRRGITKQEMEKREDKGKRERETKGEGDREKPEDEKKMSWWGVS